jgi:hypothetical protein
MPRILRHNDSKGLGLLLLPPRRWLVCDHPARCPWNPAAEVQLPTFKVAYGREMRGFSRRTPMDGDHFPPIPLFAPSSLAKKICRAAVGQKGV